MTIDQTPGSELAGRIFEPLETEHSSWVERTEGVLPEGLSGTLYRNGPGRLEVGGSPLGHMFDGDGMLSRFTFTDGRVHYANKYVRTNHYRAGQTSTGAPMRGLGTLKPGGPLANAFRLPANVANTSVAFHAGDLLALWEGGKPHRLDPDTLETFGTHDYGGQLRWLGAFSAHPKFDPRTGDMFNFGVELIPRPHLSCYRVDSAGTMRRIAKVGLAEPVFCHDFALTTQHMVFVIDPLGISLRSLPKVGLGLTTFDRALTFKHDRPTVIVLQPRDGSRPRRVEVPSFLHFHVNNAFEDGTDTVVDLVRWDRDWESFNQSLRSYRQGDPDRPKDWEFGGYLTRLRITRDDRVLVEDLTDVAGEFPQLDQRLSTLPHHTTYIAARIRPGEEADSVVKVDHRTGERTEHLLPAGHTVSEPIFVPRSPDAEPDDGWLLAVAYDPVAHRSRLLVLDTADLSAPPVFTAHLDHHVPQSFHGIHTARTAQVG